MGLLPQSNRVNVLLKSLGQLGIKPMALLAVYRLGIISGYYRRVTPPGQPLVSSMRASTLLRTGQPGPLDIPDSARLGTLLSEEAKAEAVSLADEVVGGQVRLFGTTPRPMVLKPAGPLLHWTEYKDTLAGPGGDEDIKFTWEQGRLGWLYPLARAYVLTGDERYPEAFWRYLEEFLQANPANLGPHWSSAQEVAIRLLGLVFAGQVFHSSPQTTEDRLHLLALAVETHAARIPPTLVYARAQNNNHLITEALGLLAAGWALVNHPKSAEWEDMGWRWLTGAFDNQVEPDGLYIQYSTNYHRLMLQSALWGQCLLRQQGKSLPSKTCKLLAAAATWLLGRMDTASGDVSNFGANDGAYLFPLAGGGWRDFRPVIQAAGYAFAGGPLLPAGDWDEMSMWFGLLQEESNPAQNIGTGQTISPSSEDMPVPGRISDPASGSWASLNAVHYSARPSHADQLHVDLWWQGNNIARDAGTYQYNSAPPWDNALAGAAFHNTILIDDQDQMLRAGRFLWLDWAQARFLAPLSVESQLKQISAEHEGYARLGVRHLRTLALLSEGRWLVQDTLAPGDFAGKDPHRVLMQWLLPDWNWQMEGTRLTLQGQPGRVEIEIRTEVTGQDRLSPAALGLARAGVLVAGKGAVRPQHGWYAPAYGEKQTALSLLAGIESTLPVEISTIFTLIPENT